MLIKLRSLLPTALALVALAACTAPQGTVAPSAATQVEPTEVLSTPTLAAPTDTPLPSETPTPEISPTPETPVRFAVIGDYGHGGPDEFAVAELIDSWLVDFIVTTGDNNYPDGEAETIDDNIGQFYHRYIGNYQGEYNRGSAENRFFPSLGNHDWNPGNIDAYLDYFDLPGNERYYDVVQGEVHLFILDSDTNEPDGVGRSSDQAAWLQDALAGSTTAWQVVVFHHPAYSSGYHTSTEWMQWPFSDWGVDAVLSGHDHLYERLEVDGLLYITNGLGGHEAIYEFGKILPESMFRYNDLHGAMLVEATSIWVRFDFYNVEGGLVDSYTLTLLEANP
ncbi:MAG: metallophosphoesterase [Anaerolineales bacterium]